MGRRKRNIPEACCYHVTHRCHGRSFLFKFDIDRQNYINRLREMNEKFPVDVLNYIVTSNHIHLLLWSSSGSYISQAMHFLQSTTAKDYNQRIGREGAFWSNRYHPTLIEPGNHLSRCIFYIDFNMVRAKAVEHPFDWKYSGCHELAGIRKRYRIINLDCLLNCLGFSNKNLFFKWYNAVVEKEAEKTSHLRQAIWSKALAVGRKEWIEDLSSGLLRTKISPVVTEEYERYEQSGQNTSSFAVNEPKPIYGLYGTNTTKKELWKKHLKNS